MGKKITIQFADNRVINTVIRENLEKMIEDIRNECNKWGLSMNVNKTKYLCIGEDISNLKIGNDERVENYKQQI